MATVSDLPGPLADRQPAALEAARRRRRRGNAGLRYGVLAGVGLIMLYPLIRLIASFKPNAEIFASPGNPTLNGYIAGWQTSTP